jgi:hypothetical protein
MSFDPNPYAPPPADPQPGWKPSGIDYRLQKTIRDFRSQMLALGVAWIILGVLAGGIGVFMASSMVRPAGEYEGILVGIFAVSSLMWLTMGTCTCLKQMWAVYTGLVLSYISLVGNLLGLNICAVILFIAIIVQAHRVIGFASQIKRAGLPLDAKP